MKTVVAGGLEGGWDLERFRAYLEFLARTLMGPLLRGKFEASDVVQDTLLEAIKSRERYRGTTDGELAEWLRKILAHNLIDAARALDRQKRKADLERSLEATLIGTSRRLLDVLSDGKTSPSWQAIGSQESLRLWEALRMIPEHQRRAVELMHLQGFSLKETSGEMEKTTGAVASLLNRGLKNLRHLLEGAL